MCCFQIDKNYEEEARRYKGCVLFRAISTLDAYGSSRHGAIPPRFSCRCCLAWLPSPRACTRKRARTWTPFAVCVPRIAWRPSSMLITTLPCAQCLLWAHTAYSSVQLRVAEAITNFYDEEALLGLCSLKFKDAAESVDSVHRGAFVRGAATTT